MFYFIAVIWAIVMVSLCLIFLTNKSWKKVLLWSVLAILILMSIPFIFLFIIFYL